MVEVMQFTPGPAISRKRTLEKRLTNIRESAPRGTIYTQLRPGKYDYTLWMKIMRPNGSGRYERRDLSEIDPERNAPKLEVKFPRPTPEYQEELNNLSERSRKTLNSISEAGNSISVDTDADSREDVEGFMKHSNKRNRSSPGEANTGKRNRRELVNEEPHDLRITRNVFQNLGLVSLMKVKEM